MICFASLAFFLIGFVALSSRAMASPEDKTFHLNVSPNGYPPYLIVDGETPSGIMWDAVLLIADRLGYTLMAEKIPRKRVDQMLLDGYVDGTPRAIEWTEQPERFLFTDPIVNSEEVFFIPKKSAESYESPADLFSKTLVTQLGFHYPPLEPYFSAGTIQRFDVSRTRDMFTFVLHGDRFHAAVADRLVGQWILRNEGLQDEFRTSREVISQYGFRIMVTKQWADFVDAFNNELARIRKNGELDAILANYR
ncbi:substrate-binding periplasmic protein [Marinobacter salinus]|uniref:substrate-binding periplasmic protein n=1 Tax=Marinobacter salinus TaxID=1874317 RepID=UPI001D0D659A|nr:ABC transporter substrate-binding protein [Marinobacter salinus]